MSARAQTAAETPISQNRHESDIIHMPQKAKSAAEDGAATYHNTEMAARRSSFLERVLAQQKQQQLYRSAYTKQRAEEKRAEAQRNSVKRTFAQSFSAHPASKRTGATEAVSDARSKHNETFAVSSSSLKTAPDGLHYIEDVGSNVVDAKEKKNAPLCVMLVHRRLRHPQRTPDVGGNTLADTDIEEDQEEVVVRYLPMSDLLSAIKKTQKQNGKVGPALAGLRRVHDGKEGLSTMHLEVDPDFSFLPEVFKADEKADHGGYDAGNDNGSAAGGGDATTRDLSPQRRQQEPNVYDYFIPPTMRNVELLKEKHKNGMSYLKHKMKYSKGELEEMGRKDRRSYLSCERRFLFMRQLQRDLDRRLENEQRLRRRQERQRRMLGRMQLLQQQNGLGHQHDGSHAWGRGSLDEVLYTGGDVNAGIGYHGNNLYITGREIPEDLVQTFFSLNDEYEAFQRSLERRQQRRRVSGAGGAGGNVASQTDNDDVDLVTSMMRWGDMLLFPGQRPVDGYVMVTAGPAGMRGWRRVLTGQNGGSSRAAAQHSGGRRVKAPASRHIDLYAMSQRAAYQPDEANGNNSYTATLREGNGGNHDADEEDEYSYLRHFRYQLFYANESDMDSDDDLLCGEVDTPQRPTVASGPVVYGTGYYIPRDAAP